MGKEIFARSWTHVPVMSWIVTKGNLPGVLLLLLLFAAGEQIRANTLLYWQQLEKLNKEVQILLVMDRVGCLREVFHSIFHICDIGGAILLTRVLMDLHKAHRGSYPMNRAGSFLGRVVKETLPSLWFTISLFCMSYDTATSFQKINSLFSIGSSFMTAVSGTYDLLPWIVATLRDGRVQRAFRTCRYEAQTFLSVVFMALFLPYQLVRFGGAFYCESHIYNPLQVGCMPSDP